MVAIAIADAFVIALAIAGILYVTVRFANDARDRALRANSPPGARIEATDTTEEVIAKNRNYRLLLNAIRLLHEVRQHDEMMPSLPSNLRKEIDDLLRDFYG